MAFVSLRADRARARLLRAGLLAAAVIPVGVFTSASHAWLGGFEQTEGYQGFLNMVQTYNAGQYGPGSGYVAPLPVAIPPNTGLWTAINGGFFSGGAVSSATGHFATDRTYVNTSGGSGTFNDQGLVLTTGHEGFGGPALKYKYNIDSQDLGGIAPASTGGTTVSVSFWNRGQINTAVIGGQVPFGYFGNEIAFQDSLGNIGFRLGLTARASGDKITYWDGTSLVESALVGSSNFFDRWDISFDLLTNKVSASYFQFATSTTFNVVNSMPLMTPMSDFSGMTFRSSPGDNNNKIWAVDDFRFHAVPGAPTLLALLPGALIASRRRRN